MYFIMYSINILYYIYSQRKKDVWGELQFKITTQEQPHRGEVRK